MKILDTLVQGVMFFSLCAQFSKRTNNEILNNRATQFLILRMNVKPNPHGNKIQTPNILVETGKSVLY